MIKYKFIKIVIIIKIGKLLLNFIYQIIISNQIKYINIIEEKYEKQMINIIIIFLNKGFGLFFNVLNG